MWEGAGRARSRRALPRGRGNSPPTPAGLHTIATVERGSAVGQPGSLQSARCFDEPDGSIPGDRARARDARGARRSGAVAPGLSLLPRAQHRPRRAPPHRGRARALRTRRLRPPGLDRRADGRARLRRSRRAHLHGSPAAQSGGAVRVPAARDAPVPRAGPRRERPARLRLLPRGTAAAAARDRRGILLHPGGGGVRLHRGRAARRAAAGDAAPDLARGARAQYRGGAALVALRRLPQRRAARSL